MVKNPPANAEDMTVMDLIPGSGKSSGVGSGNPFQYSCLENPMDRGAWQATYSPWSCKESNITELVFVNAYTFIQKLFVKCLSALTFD